MKNSQMSKITAKTNQSTEEGKICKDTMEWKDNRQLTILLEEIDQKILVKGDSKDTRIELSYTSKTEPSKIITNKSVKSAQGQTNDWMQKKLNSFRVLKKKEYNRKAEWIKNMKKNYKEIKKALRWTYIWTR